MQPIVARGYEKSAWLLIAIIAAVGIAFSFMLLAGIQLDLALPAFATSELYLARVAGMSLLGFALAGLAISYTAFRRGEKWAWYFMWFLPIFLVYSVADNYAAGGANWPLYVLFLFMSVAAMILPYRLFFAKR